jgi:MFS transporter, DHA2 family, multidrug resistance protein
MVLFGVALVGFIYGIGQIPNGFTDPRTRIPLTISIVAFVGLLRWERHHDEPALDLSIFVQPAFVVAVLATLTYDFLVGGYGVVLGQFGTAVLGLSEAAIGLFYLPGTLIAAAASVLAGLLIQNYTARVILIWGLLISAASGIVMATPASPSMALWVLVLATFLTTLGTNITATPASDIILSHAPPERAGAVASMKPAFSMTGYSLGPTIYVLLLQVFSEGSGLRTPRGGD